MKFFISPAKKMRMDDDFILPKTTPVFLDRAKEIAAYLQTLSLPKLQETLSCNEQIAILNFERYQSMDFSRNLSPAIFAYDGIQYQYMAPQVFEADYFPYIQSNLRILSGLYGVLRQFDGVLPYRLEMGCKKLKPFCDSLYALWGDAIYKELTKEGDVLINLASAEYARCVLAYRKPSDRIISCMFAEDEGGKLCEKGVYVKMARGEMVRFLAERQAAAPEIMKEFDRLDYHFSEVHSTGEKYVFIRRKTVK